MGHWRALVPGLLLGIAAGSSARAQEVVADSLEVTVEEPALEFRTNVPWARVVLAGRQSVAGRSPLRVPGPLLGKFWLEAGGPGLDRQRGRIRFSLDDSGSRVYSYGGIPARQALVRSLVLPGLSQARSRQELKGASLITLAAGGVGLVAWAHHGAGSAEDAVQSLSDRIDVETDPVVIEELTEARYDARADQEHREARRELFLKATGVVWTVGFLDALAFRPRFHVQDADGESLTLGLRRATRGRAILRSLVFPGLGQEYNGERGKAIWVASSAILAGSYLVWRQDDVEREEAALRQAEERVDDNPGPDATLRRDGKLRDRDGARDARDLAAWVAAGVWGLSLLDTALSFQEPWGDVPVEGSSTGTIGWAVDPARGEVAALVRF
jgi:hypothetical protein